MRSALNHLMFYDYIILPILVAKSILSKQDHVLQGSELLVQYYSDESEDVGTVTVPETDTLEVRNLPHNISTDALQLYFESPKSGGCDDGVKEIRLEESGVAHVQLTDATGEYVLALRYRQSVWVLACASVISWARETMILCI